MCDNLGGILDIVCVVQINHAIRCTCHKRRVRRTKSNTENRMGKTAVIHNTTTNVRKPETNAAINATGQKVFTILAEMHANDIFRMTKKKFLQISEQENRNRHRNRNISILQ